MPTEARGNYFPEPPYLRETKTYHSQPLESTRHAGNYFVPNINTAHFYFFVAEVMSNYLTTDGLRKFSLLPEAPLRPESRGICHICHMVNPALLLNCAAFSWVGEMRSLGRNRSAPTGAIWRQLSSMQIAEATFSCYISRFYCNGISEQSLKR